MGIDGAAARGPEDQASFILALQVIGLKLSFQAWREINGTDRSFRLWCVEQPCRLILGPFALVLSVTPEKVLSDVDDIAGHVEVFPGEGEDFVSSKARQQSEKHSQAQLIIA